MGIEFEIPGRLPDQGNGVEWNTLIANRRSQYDLGLNCWVKGQEGKGNVTIMLRKDQQDQWRRADVGNLHLMKSLRKSVTLFFPTTRPYHIPHKVSGDKDWAIVLAHEVDQEIEDAMGTARARQA
ncbi:MAG: hypothetical protein Q9160_000574 [Pyrenula sp. 1 TL-2023]